MSEYLIYLQLSIVVPGVIALVLGSIYLWNGMLQQVWAGETVRLPFESGEDRSGESLVATDATEAERPSTVSSEEKARSLSRQLLVPALATGLWAALALQSQVQLQLGQNDDPPVPIVLDTDDLAATALESLAVTVIALVLVASAFSPIHRPEDFGFTARNLREQIFTGAMGFMAALVPVLLVILLSSPLRGDDKLHPFLKLLEEQLSVTDLSLIFLTAAVLAPIKEELLFRVILQPFLQGFLPPAAAIGVVALVFAAVHGLPDALAIVPLALILGYVFHRTRSFLAVVTLHALFNSYNLVLMTTYVAARRLPGVE